MFRWARSLWHESSIDRKYLEVSGVHRVWRDKFSVKKYYAKQLEKLFQFVLKSKELVNITYASWQEPESFQKSLS